MRQLPLPFCLIFDLPVDEPIGDLFDYTALTLLNGHEVFASLISNLCLSVTSNEWTDLEVRVQLVSDPLSQLLKPQWRLTFLSPKLLAIEVVFVASMASPLLLLRWNKLNSFHLSIDFFLTPLALLHRPSEGIIIVVAFSGHPSAIDWDCDGKLLAISNSSFDSPARTERRTFASTPPTPLAQWDWWELSLSSARDSPLLHDNLCRTWAPLKI